jgi:hypothetical protein
MTCMYVCHHNCQHNVNERERQLMSNIIAFIWGSQLFLRNFDRKKQCYLAIQYTIHKKILL